MSISFHTRSSERCSFVQSPLACPLRFDRSGTAPRIGTNNQRRNRMSSATALIEPTDSGVVESIFKRSIRDGEKKLMLAVIENAIEDFQKYVLASDKRGMELFQDAEQWILETNSASLFSFESICVHLDLDPDYVRRGFMRWKAAKLNGGLKRTSNRFNRRIA
jgi:hypothetical protein